MHVASGGGVDPTWPKVDPKSTPAPPPNSTPNPPQIDRATTEQRPSIEHNSAETRPRNGPNLARIDARSRADRSPLDARSAPNRHRVAPRQPKVEPKPTPSLPRKWSSRRCHTHLIQSPEPTLAPQGGRRNRCCRRNPCDRRSSRDRRSPSMGPPMPINIRARPSLGSAQQIWGPYRQSGLMSANVGSSRPLGCLGEPCKTEACDTGDPGEGQCCGENPNDTKAAGKLHATQDPHLFRSCKIWLNAGQLWPKLA